MSDFWDVLADVAAPLAEVSRWYCDRLGCDGEPHGPSWHWCGHPEGSHPRHEPSCRHARAQQVPPVGDWFVWLLLAGRGLGKSRAASEWLLEAAWTSEPGEWCTIARNAGDVRKNARDMTAGLVVLAERDGRLDHYNRHEEDIFLRNGSVIHCLSADKPDRLRGFNLMGAWADELSSWRYAADTWDYGLMPALRAGSHPRVVVTTTPKPVPLLKRLVKEAEAEAEKPEHLRSKVLRTGSTWDNAANLAANFIAEMRSTYGGTRVGRQELEGELLFDVSGALVTLEMIEEARCTMSEAEERSGGFTRVVVAVDPAGSYGERSDETGIVVCAKGRDGHGYVLSDLSCKKSPREWATIAAAAYERWQADRIVAEKNMGHDLVEDVIRTVAPTIAYKPIQAVQGKRLRAEPVTALYEQTKIHHVGTFPQLEDQLTTWDPEASQKSPDRMDALVHGMTELGLARWGSTHAFMSMMRKQIELRQEYPDAMADKEMSRAVQSIVGRRSRTDVLQRKAQRLCQHRWRGDTCVFCGTVRDSA